MSTARYNKVPIQSEEPEYIDGDDHERNDDPSSNTQERETTSDPSTVENTTTNVTAVTTTTTTSTSEKESNDLLNEVSATSNTNTITVDDAIENLGMGKFQLLVLTAAGLCFASDAMQVLLLSFLCEVLKLEWNLTDRETALITSMVFIGAIFGTLVLGPLADKKGRKPIFLLAATIISFFGGAVSFVTDYWMLLTMLFMVGFGVGGLTVPFDILAEFLPANSRGRNLLVIEYFWTIGVLLVVLCAYLTLGNGEENGNWRLFVILCSIPCLLSIFIGCAFVPESPRWLCTQGRTEEALDIIRYAAKTNGLDPDILYPSEMQLVDEEEEESNFLELFSPRWRWTTILLWGTWGAFAFGYYGTIMVITEIFDHEEDNDDGTNSTHDDGGDGTGGATYNFDYGAIFLSSSAELVGTTYAILAVDKAGRIPLQVLSYAMAGLCVSSLCVMAANHADRTVLIALGFAARIFEMGGSCVSWVSTAEILTTEVRTTGHSAANAVARIGSLFSPFLIEGGSSLVKKGIVMLVIHAITVICVSQLPETKGGQLGGGGGDRMMTTTNSDEEIEDLSFSIVVDNDTTNGNGNDNDNGGTSNHSNNDEERIIT